MRRVRTPRRNSNQQLLFCDEIMNGYERMMAAMQLQQPDQVPIFEVLVHENVWSSLCPEAQSKTDFEEMMDFDGVCCGGQFRAVEERGDYYTDEWGVVYKRGGLEDVNHPVEAPLQSINDLSGYVPPDPDAPWRLGKLPDLVDRFKAERAIVFHLRTAFMDSAYLMGLDQMLMNFLIDPQFVEAVMDVVLETNMRVVRNAVRAGADIILVGDDYASNDAPLMSPQTFREFIAPRLARMVEMVHEEGAYLIKHSDGNLWSILDDILDTGADGLNPIEPQAGMDIERVKQYCGDRVCLSGNIDCGHLLPHGSAEQVRQAVIECLRKAAFGGGFIMHSSNSIHSSVNPENYRTMIEATRRYGRYPLQLPTEGAT